MGFWSGFAQGWEAESERIERRKLFQQELKDKRVGTLAELIAKGYGRAASSSNGVPATAGSDATPTAGSDHYMRVLANYNMSPDDVARINAEGGVYGLKAAAETLQENEGAVTPELLKRLPDAIVVTQREGSSVDARTIADKLFGPDFYGSLEPEDQAILEMSAQGSTPEPYVTTALNIPDPIKPEDINQTIGMANQTLVAELTARKAQAEQSFREAQDAGEDNAAQFAAEASRIDGLITQVEAGNIVPAIDEVGDTVIGPYLENNPRLKSDPALLGPWRQAAERYLSGGQDQTQEAIPVEDSAPQPGDVIDGWQFLGGDPGDPNNWEKVNG